MPDIDQTLTVATIARLVICGPSPDAAVRLPRNEPPCYQLLAATGDPDTCHSWLRLTSVPADIDALPSSPLSSDDAQILAEVMGDASWLLLVMSDAPESPVLASAIGAFAKARGMYVTAFLPASFVLAPTEHAVLSAATSFLCRCPPTLPALPAAEVLWTSVMWQGTVGVDYADLHGNLAGNGHLLWAPLRQNDDQRIRAMLSQLEDFEARDTLWAVLVLPESCSLEDFTTVGEFLHEHCHEDCSLIVTLPETQLLPLGLYVFVG